METVRESVPWLGGGRVWFRVQAQRDGFRFSVLGWVVGALQPKARDTYRARVAS